MVSRSKLAAALEPQAGDWGDNEALPLVPEAVPGAAIDPAAGSDPTEGDRFGLPPCWTLLVGRKECWRETTGEHAPEDVMEAAEGSGRVAELV